MPTQAKEKDDLLYDQHSPASPTDGRRGKVTDRPRDGIDGLTRVDAFKSTLWANDSTVLQVQIGSAQKAWSAAPETASAAYFIQDATAV